jgi:hypothetical protein
VVITEPQSQAGPEPGVRGPQGPRKKRKAERGEGTGGGGGVVEKSFKIRRMQHRTSKGPGPANRPNGYVVVVARLQQL